MQLLIGLAFAEAPLEIPADLPVAEWGEPVLAEDAIVQYQARHLRVRDVKGQDVGWVVQDGGGNPVDTFWLAEHADDRQAQDLLAKELKQAKIVQWTAVSVGGTLVGLAAIPVARIDHTLAEPEWQTYRDRVQRDNFDTESDYLAAIDEQQSLYQNDLGAFQTASSSNADRRWTALALAGGGVMTLAVAPYAVQGMIHKRREPANTWSRSRIEALVEEHNRTLRADLGLPGGERPSYEDDGWEATLYEPEPPRFTVAPQVGPTYLGLQFRF
ncbi:MAG: hypothetical protein GY913_00700 [Proteobacteria bacterium]|nr:hypothetical protein [Pseudomonadota bacterium]MCP4915416.1 hypothetical protein [Pseudomonadota bacterium]